MLLQWSQHSQEMVEKLSSLLSRESLLDITLAAEGKYIKAHKVVLAAASKYFEDLLCSTPDQIPVIFFRDVSFTELESLVQFIYSGDTRVPGNCLQSFLSLAHSLGVSGFTDSPDQAGVTSPARRKIVLSESFSKCPESEKENLNPINSALSTPSKKSSSEPASMAETAVHCSASKKRKLFTQSLDEISSLQSVQSPLPSLPNSLFFPHPQDPQHSCPPSHSQTLSCPAYSSANPPNNHNNSLSISDQPLYSNLPRPPPPPYPTDQPLYANLPQSQSPIPSQPLYANVPKSPSTNPKSSHQADDSCFKVPLPPHHVSTSSCPAPPSPALPSQSPSKEAAHSSNFSFDSHFLDPDELAAKGATLLHHLAVWMIQQKKEGATLGGSSHTVVGDELPAPTVEESSKVSSSGHCYTQSLPARRQAAQSSSFSTNLQTLSRSTLRPGSECDRPDSGFDSKDEKEEEPSAREEGSSPEAGEMSRQAVARQPLKKKRNFQHNF